MTPESKVKEQVKAILKKHNAYYFMPVANVFARAGVPDIIACLHGLFIGIECKAGKNTCTKLQLLEHAKIKQAKGTVFVVNETNLDALDVALSEIENVQSV